MSEALKCASQLADMTSKYKTPSTQRGWLNGAIEELRRLAGVEAELQQAQEERTAWRVTAENAEAAVKQARIDALEEAKQACQKRVSVWPLNAGSSDYDCEAVACADAIESLKETP